jgi:hypothetical protein
MKLVKSMSAARAGVLGALVVLVGLAYAGFAYAGAGDTSISAPVLGSTLVISTSTQFAGAISSLTWRGKQFINASDHGRELQSASSFDGLGECFNPTEAGSLADGATSTSKLLGISASGNRLQTTSQMAFWTPAGSPYPQGCGGNQAIKVAQNTTNLSSHVHSKQVTIGFNGIPNVIEYMVNFHVPENHQSATFEAVTGYMTGEFSSFFTFDPKAGDLRQISAGPGEQPVPLIFATPDRTYAMGIYSPDQPQIAGIGYGRFNFASQGTMKWNCVYRTGATPAGDYAFNRNYIVVGTLADVVQGMTSVNQVFFPSGPTNRVSVDRFYMPSTGEHFFTASLAEGINAGFVPEGIGFHVFAAGAGIANTVPIYRCYGTASHKHFISAAANCEGQAFEGSYGNVYASPTSGATALYRFAHPTNGDRLETTSFSEGSGAGYTFEGTLGYVPVP